jgi:hypothetical protein
MPRLIDLTDPKFMIAANRAVIEHIRRTNPFAHSDLGSKLIALGNAIPGIAHYSPNYRAYAYVVLYCEAHVIFALAEGMWNLAFRLPSDAVPAALAEDAAPSKIGDDWISAAAFDPALVNRDRKLAQWCEAAYRHARTLG